MESVMEYIHEIDIAQDRWIDASVSILNSIDSLNNSLLKAVQNIEELNTTLDSWSEDVLMFRAVDIRGKSRDEEFSTIEQYRSASGQEKVNASDLAKKENHLDQARKVAKSISDAGAAFEKIHPGIKNLAGVLKGISGVATTASGASKIIDAADGKGSIAEGIVGASEMLAGTIALAETEILFGPPGWILAAGTIIAGATAYVYSKKDEQENKLVAEKEQKERSLQSFMMSGAEADDYINSIDSRKPVEKRPWKNSYDPVKENVNKYGKTAYDLIVPLPYQQADNLSVRLNLPPDIDKYRENKMPVEVSYNQRTSDLQQRVRYAALNSGKSAMDTVIDNELTKAKIYDQKNHTHTIDKTKSAIKEAVSSVIHQANDNRLIPVSGPKELHRRSSERYSHKLKREGSSITINLNRPMIEHFTINTQNVNGGVSDFKHKVEEVLLEILNSANVIQ